MTLGLGEFYSVACALAWAIAVVLFKKSGESLAPIPLNLFKNVLAIALFLVTIVALQGPTLPDIPGTALLWILLSGFLGIGLGDTLYLKALNSIGASRMAVAQTAYTPFVILFSVPFLGERLSLPQLGGVALVLAGIVLVTWTRAAPVDARRLRVGALYAALSVAVMAAGVVIAKPMLERYDFLWVVTLRVVGGLLGLAVFILWKKWEKGPGSIYPKREKGPGSIYPKGEKGPGSIYPKGEKEQSSLAPSSFSPWSFAGLRDAYRAVRHWPVIIAAAVMGTYVSMMLWLAGYKYTSASISAVLNETAALFILALSVVFLRERVTPRQFAGTTLAMAGVVVVVTV